MPSSCDEAMLAATTRMTTTIKPKNSTAPQSAGGFVTRSAHQPQPQAPPQHPPVPSPAADDNLAAPADPVDRLVSATVDSSRTVSS